MNYKDIFDTLISFTKTRCLIRGWADIVEIDDTYSLKEFTEENFVIIAGLFSEDMIKDAFIDLECKVDQEGMYEFTALLNYSGKQINPYEPQNIEVEEYMEIEHIEYKFILSSEDIERNNKESETFDFFFNDL